MKTTTIRLLALALAAVGLLGLATTAHAELVGHWTLDNLTTGIANQGTDGGTSDLTAAGGPSATTGIIGAGAIQFDGTDDILSNYTSGNAGDDLAGFPFTMSTWVRPTDSGDPNKAPITVNDNGDDTNFFGQRIREGNYATVNNDSGDNRVVDTTTGDPYDGSWHNFILVFDSSPTVTFYADGKQIHTSSDLPTFPAADINGVAIGAFTRTVGYTSGYKGDIDDVGLFDTALGADDVALINGLGQTGGIGLDQLDEAQALLAGSVGGTATIGGATWEKISGLTGATGDYSGNVGNLSAVIQTDDTGSGIRTIPEPNSLALLGLAGLLTLMLRRRGRK